MFTRHDKPTVSFTLISLVCLIVLTLGSCSSPFVFQNSEVFNLSVRFVLPGSQSLASGRIPSDGSATQSRLLLPSARNITLTLTPENGGEVLRAGPNPVSNGSATITVNKVPVGRYTIVAEAKDLSGTIVFKQVARNMNVGGSTEPLIIPMVPTNTSGSELSPETWDEIAVPAIPVGESRSWLLSPESKLLKASSIFIPDLSLDSYAYILSAEGLLLGQVRGNGKRLDTSTIPAGKSIYLTVYNDGTLIQGPTKAFAGPIMVRIPAGTEPSTGVPLSSFSMASTELTQELFQAIMGFNYSVAGHIGPTIPVGNVTMYDAMVFCNALSIQEGLDPVYTLTGVSHFGAGFASSINAATYSADFLKNGYRLPTLSERIWATRGGRTTLYHWGDDPADAGTYEWYGSSGLKPVSGKAPNGYGLYDMGGNCYEWNWGSDNPAVPGSNRAGGTVAAGVTMLQSTQNVTWGAGTGGALGYWDNGFRVVRGDLPQYTVSYHSNGSSSGTVPSSVTVLSGASLLVSSDVGNLKKTEFGLELTLETWNTKPDGSGSIYVPGVTSINSIFSNVDLYAQWSSGIGQTGPGGGVVFYKKPSRTNGWQYMEMTTENIAGSLSWGLSELLGGTSVEIGFGMENTLAFVNKYPLGNYAANACVEYRGGGLSDWFLPTYKELHEFRNSVANNLLGIATDVDGYWSSSEASVSGSYNYTKFGLEFSSRGKSLGLKIRAARRF